VNDVPRISDAEWEVMRVVWDRHPIEAGEVAEHVCTRRDWTERTVKTLLSRLVQKGALGFRRRGKKYRYYPRVPAEDCVREASQSFVDRVFGGAVRPALLHFAREADLSPEELAELERLLDDGGNGAS